MWLLHFTKLCAVLFILCESCTVKEDKVLTVWWIRLAINVVYICLYTIGEKQTLTMIFVCTLCMKVQDIYCHVLYKSDLDGEYLLLS